MVVGWPLCQRIPYLEAQSSKSTSRVDGLLQVLQEEPDIPGRRATRKHCGWKGSQPKEYVRRQPLQALLGSLSQGQRPPG